MNLRGCGTALVTPFRHDGAVDETALRELVSWQVASGINFLVPCGTTGETPTLSRKEWLRVADITIEVAAGRVPIVVGATSNCTRDAIEKARILSERAGVDGILTASPYYNKPTQEGQYQHFRAIAQAVKKSLILYNIPGRTGVNIEPATLARLAQVRNIIGVKEASGNVTQIVDIFNTVPEDFLVFSGDDAVTLPVIALGGAGVISVASNEIPREMAEMTRAALDNDWDTARRIHRHYLPLMEANFIESNPLPVKAALAMMGKIKEIYRLPLVRMGEDTRAKLQKVMISCGLEVKLAEASRRRPAAQVEAAVAAAATAASVEMETVTEGAREQVAVGSPAAVASDSQPAAEMVATESSVSQASAAEEERQEAQAVNPEPSSQEASTPPLAALAESAAIQEMTQEPAAASIPQAAPVAAPQPITFYLNENWQAGPHKTVLHRSTCGACRNGTGRAGQDQNRSRWHGPYSNADEARQASRAMADILIRSECKCIMKGETKTIS
jgi:4-hydroxy-tetrahydrodipicolinate synthase